MAKSDDAAEERDEAEMLPDEREAIAERLDSLDDGERVSLAEARDRLASEE